MIYIFYYIPLLLVRSDLSPPHLLEDGFVIVNVVDPHDDLGGAAERVRPPRGVVVGGGDVEDVLRPPQAGRRTAAKLDDAYAHRHTQLISLDSGRTKWII